MVMFPKPEEVATKKASTDSNSTASSTHSPTSPTDANNNYKYNNNYNNGDGTVKKSLGAIDHEGMTLSEVTVTSKFNVT